MRSLAALLVLGSMSPLVAAQASLVPSLTHDQAYPQGLPPITNTFAGDVDGDWHTDVLAQAGTHVALFYSPPYASYTYAFDAGALDMAGAPDLGPGGVDAVVITRSGQAPALVSYDPSVVTPTQPDPFSVTTLGLSSAWHGAQQIVVSRDGDHVLYGVDSAGQTLLVAEGVFGGGSVTESSVSIGSPILDLASLDWNGGSADEIAVAHQAGLGIYARNGTLQLGLPGSLADAQMVTFRQSGVTKDRLAAVVDVPGVADQLLQVLSDGVAEPAVLLGSSQVHAVVAADFDKDGDDDLIMANRVTLNPADIAPFVFTNLSDGVAPGPASWAFTISAPHTYPVLMGVGSTATAAQTAAPCVADFDRDGDADIYYPLETTRVTRLVRNGHTNHSDMEYRPTPPLPGFPSGLMWQVFASPTKDTVVESTYFVELDRPITGLPGATHVLVGQRTAWLEENGSTVVIDPSLAELHASAQAEELQLVDYIHHEGHDGIVVDLFAWVGPGQRMLEISQVIWDDTAGEIVAVGPPLQVALAALQTDTLDLEGLYPDTEDFFIVDGWDDDLLDGTDPSWFIGTRDGGGLSPGVDPPRYGGGNDGGSDGDGGAPEPPPPPPPPGNGPGPGPGL